MIIVIALFFKFVWLANPLQVEYLQLQIGRRKVLVLLQKSKSSLSKGAKGGDATKTLKPRKYSSSSEAPRFLAKLFANKDDCFLIEFHSDNSDHARQMEPVLERLEEDLQTKVRRINVSRRREFYGLLEAMGHDECGTLPFYYNEKLLKLCAGQLRTLI